MPFQATTILEVINDDRSICKNRSRSKDGGCNALQSLHPHDHCLLDNPQGAAFDGRPKPRVPKKEGERRVGVNIALRTDLRKYLKILSAKRVQ